MQALNMRKPAGGTIQDMQRRDRDGTLQRPLIVEQNFGNDMMYAFEEKFTDIELEKFKEAFIFFDRDGDGTMKAEDLGLALRSMGGLVSNKEVEVLLRKYDPDRVGTIDLNDFIACMAEIINKPDNEEEIRTAFSVFDKEDNELLSASEMGHVLTRIGDTLSQEEVTNFINILDVYGDGHIRMEELTSLLLPQTNKDVYSRAVGGQEGIERSQMSYGAPQVDLNREYLGG
eukprot:CAMPEP_0170547044 /NCGR_PEP_ID=MMETSP0211-20121228/5400_1 /TAXON_ID=311385 /ORGANISM="Pseudokeronopsis sp., Strain OXSARD2" /LENGTH=229 /DNA_ID=CAMNT_0010851831 /DNA_START=20 /DNA_END=706 /DNA_ORIENTATION=-